MAELVEVEFKGNRKDFFTWDEAQPPSVGVSVLVEIDRGQDLGRVSAVGEVAAKKCGVGCNGCALAAAPREPSGRIVRPASDDERKAGEQLRKAEDDVRRKVMEKVRAHDLDMKVSDTEWQWDRKRLTIYFTAEQRVDFRALVRDLAGLFRTRIEMRQIGARDEAKRLEGVGRCGREYCCSSWLPELLPVSLSLAKDQHLSLNPSQISGGCGRLLCCLRYEHDFYVASRKRFPREGKTIQTSRGAERVVAVDIFRERVLLRADGGESRTLTLAELKAETAGSMPGPQANAPEDSEKPPPANPTTVTEEHAAESVSPRPKSRRRRRRGRRGRGSEPPPESSE